MNNSRKCKAISNMRGKCKRLTVSDIGNSCSCTACTSSEFLPCPLKLHEGVLLVYEENNAFWSFTQVHTYKNIKKMLKKIRKRDERLCVINSDQINLLHTHAHQTQCWKQKPKGGAKVPPHVCRSPTWLAGSNDEGTPKKTMDSHKQKWSQAGEALPSGLARWQKQPWLTQTRTQNAHLQETPKSKSPW